MSSSGKRNWRSGRRPYTRKTRNNEGARSTFHIAPARVNKAMQMTVDQMIAVESARAQWEREVARAMKNPHRDEHRIAYLKRQIGVAEKELRRLGNIHRALESEKEKDL